MRPIAPSPKDQGLDADDLNLLSFFHFVGAGLAFLAIPFFIVRFVLSHAALSNPSFLQNQKQPQAPELSQALHLITWLYVATGVWLVAAVILNILSGFFLRRRKHRMFSLVVAGMNCLHFPLGTVLGVFTFVVLDRESVKELYEAGKY